MSPPEVQGLVARLPERPGCYLFKDRRGEVIYVGKALSLRQRVSSYFHESRPAQPRTDALVSHIRDLEFITTDTELEALVLENNLIKEYKPRYNVVLRDDKNFPHLRLSLSERFPRLTIVRRPRKGKDAYFGPYLPASEARRTMRLVHQEFQLRSCSEELDGRRPRPCLYYQIGQCLAPCVAALCGDDRYQEAVSQARLFLEGRDGELAERLEQKMTAAAGELRYEEAARMRDMLRTLGRLRESQKAASTDLDEQDVFGYHREGRKIVAHVLVKRRGLLRRREELAFQGGDDLGDDALIASIVQQLYERIPDVPREILLPCAPLHGEALAAWLASRRGGPVALRVPERGEKRRFVQMAMDNARLAAMSRQAQDPSLALEELKNVLALPALPHRIEGFDNSNIHGTDPVSSLVVFLGGVPAKDEYRRFAIKGVEGSDDFATMREVVGRRYRRVKEEGLPRPDLVLIDGGRGQVAAARQALAEVGVPDLAIVGLAKRDELLVLPGRDEPVALPRDNPALRLLQRVRDEAHRFAVAYHRKRRSKSRLTTELGRVKGLGPTRQRRLLRTFGSVDGVLRASEEEVAKVVGPMLARTIREVLASA